MEAFRHKWGLDLPLWDRYWIFLSGLMHGDLGNSISSHRPVLDDIARYAPATIELGYRRLRAVAAVRSAARRAGGGAARSVGSTTWRACCRWSAFPRRRSGWPSSCWRCSTAARLGAGAGPTRHAIAFPPPRRHRLPADRHRAGRATGTPSRTRSRTWCCRRSCWPRPRWA